MVGLLPVFVVPRRYSRNIDTLVPSFERKNTCSAIMLDVSIGSVVRAHSVTEPVAIDVL